MRRAVIRFLAVAAPAWVGQFSIRATTADERGATRPYGPQCDVGAYEFDGDYIFANSFDVAL